MRALARASCIAAGMAAALAGCASADIQRLATGAAPAYELKGRTLDALDQQAQWLCPKGHEVMHQWERMRRPEVDSNFLQRWTFAAGGLVGAVDADEARMTVQCKG